MVTLIVKNLSEETHAALKARAKRHGRSMNAEVLSILDEAARSGGKIGTALLAFGQAYGGLDLDVTRDKTPPRIVTFD